MKMLRAMLRIKTRCLSVARGKAFEFFTKRAICLTYAAIFCCKDCITASTKADGTFVRFCDPELVCAFWV